ncbi:MAG: PASTA domain-containing protein, partial [Gammaproteobacteria bacterium]
RPLEEAQSEIESAGLQVGKIEKQPTEEVASNAVWKQDPPEKTLVKEGAAVNFIVAVMPKVKIPELLGELHHIAETTIKNYGLTVGTVTRQPTNDVPPGYVIDQTPKSTEQTGVQIEKGTAVALSVSVAPPPPGQWQPMPYYHVVPGVLRQFQARGVKPDEPAKKP